MNDPHLLLTGERLALAEPRSEMLLTYHQWETDPGTIAGYGTQFPQRWETRRDGFTAQAANERHIQFEVLNLATTTPVGLTTLDVDHMVRTAEYTIVLAPEARGHGHATEATQLTLDWAFHLAHLRMVWLKVLEPNTAGAAAYRRAGFHDAGRLRQAGYWLGTPCDELIMDALAADWNHQSWATDTLTRRR